MQWWHEGICITDDRDRVDLDVVHPFLAGAYWSPGIPRDAVARAVQHSLCLSALDDEAQVGFEPIPDPRLLMGITRRPEDLYGTDGNLA